MISVVRHGFVFLFNLIFLEKQRKNLKFNLIKKNPIKKGFSNYLLIIVKFSFYFKNSIIVTEKK